jgi:hypothetical protein
VKLSQFAIAIPDTRQRSESVVLQFEKEIRVIEWGSDKAQLGGVEAGWTHINMMRSKHEPDKRRKGERTRAALVTTAEGVHNPSGGAEIILPQRRLSKKAVPHPHVIR